MAEKFVLITASQRERILQPRACTWADLRLGAAGAATETAGETETMGEMIEITEGEVHRHTIEAGEARHHTEGGVTTEVEAGVTAPGGEIIVPEDTDPTTVCSNF